MLKEKMDWQFHLYRVKTLAFSCRRSVAVFIEPNRLSFISWHQNGSIHVAVVAHLFPPTRPVHSCSVDTHKNTRFLFCFHRTYDLCEEKKPLSATFGGCSASLHLKC